VEFQEPVGTGTKQVLPNLPHPELYTLALHVPPDSYTLTGVDRESNQLVVALIDFIRTYTWDKQLETWVKASGILGGAGGGGFESVGAVYVVAGLGLGCRQTRLSREDQRRHSSKDELLHSPTHKHRQARSPPSSAPSNTCGASGQPSPPTSLSCQTATRWRHPWTPTRPDVTA
jgi:hypothetical protein